MFGIIKDCLIYLGFTPDNVTPLLILGLLGIFLIDKKFKPIKKAIYKVEDFIIRLCGALESGGDISQINLYKKGSPIELTQEGLSALKKISFKQDIDNNTKVLFKLINRFKPKNAFDIEQICVGLIRYIMSDKELNVFTNTEKFLYNNPEYNKPEYYRAAGLYLRDKYFEAHPKIK